MNRLSRLDRRSRIIRALVGVLVPTALLTVGVLVGAEREGITLDNFQTPEPDVSLTLTGASSLSELEEIVWDAGLEVEQIAEDALGVEAGSLKFVVSKTGSGDLQFIHYLKIGNDTNLDALNNVNKKYRWLKAYRDNGGDLVMTMDVNMTGGVSNDGFVSDLLVFTSVVILAYADFDKNNTSPEQETNAILSL